MTQRERLIEAEVQTLPAELQQRFRRMVAKGNTREFAIMCVSQQAPTMGMASDRQFNSSYRRSMQNMRASNREAIVAKAEAAGIRTNGKYYVGLGRYDDPLAWCSTADDVAHACKVKNLSAQGPGVNVKSVAPVEPKQKTPLADDIARRIEGQYIAADPKLAEKCRKSKSARAELREKVVAKHGRKQD